MIEVEGVSKRFGEVQALNDITFTVPSGRVIGFLGVNGAGKTTAMEIIAGVLGPDEGIVKVSGFNIFTESEDAKRNIGYLSDNPFLYDDMSVYDFLTFLSKLRGLKPGNRLKAVRMQIDLLQLGDVQARYIGHLSKGFRQRVGLAAALLHNPVVLVLDEPTEGLDPVQIAHIRTLIRQLAATKTIFLSSHILSEVQALCDDVLMIHGGRMVSTSSRSWSNDDSSQQGKVLLKVHRNGGFFAHDLQKRFHESIFAICSQDEESSFEITYAGGDEMLDEIVKYTVNGHYGIAKLIPQPFNLEKQFMTMMESKHLE